MRARVRQGPVPFHTRVFQGVGIVPGALKELAFQTFLLLYYNQVLGLSASYASLALLIALLIDAVSDPVVGSFSDNFRHRLGRRHALMYAAIVPFAASLYLLFAPPVAAQQHLFVWLLVCAVATRLSFTFYAVPWNALFAELSDDYFERSVLISYRFGVGWVVGTVFVFVIYAFVFAGSAAYPQGQLDPDNYAVFALLLASVTLIGGFASTHLTRDQVCYLQQPGDDLRRFSWTVVVEEVSLALRNADFRVLFFAVLASAVVGGTNQALQIYMNTYFWDLGGEQLKWMSVALLGSLFAFFTVLPLQTWLDKKNLLVSCSVAYMLVTMFPVTLRLLDLAPANGTGALTMLVVGTASVNIYFATIALIMFASMVADTLDVQEYRTGMRQEALFNSVIAFSGKATTGAGILIAGLIIDYVVGLPEAALRTEVTASMVFRIGVMDAYVVPLFSVVWLWLVLKYSITAEHHAAVRDKLEQRRAALSNAEAPVQISNT